MLITVFGATGGTGRLVVKQALEAGHEVRAVVRDPDRLPLEHRNLRVHQADVFDPAAIRPTLADVEAVVSALGAPSRKDTSMVCARGVRSILTAMESTCVRRIVAISAQPVLRNGGGEPFWFRSTVLPIVRALHRSIYVDLARMEQILVASAAEWTIVRPPMLTDKPGTGRYRTAFEANIAGSSLTRADLATALLDVLADPTTVRHAIGVTGP
ncbi:SDR family oxidoreductase [Micromonospora sonneratiae]|uniref:NAD(P)-dependent oxidoreductase n=1 Tax=Micromonospora sonneratiae TaxID=1184706 RepID=A0ABW3YNU5_9ACTN